ncbi:MAG: TonB-dependent receptor [Bacteroidia bacterium]|nr:TonB-dependent receptor [Bacteroidia bacterium]
MRYMCRCSLLAGLLLLLGAEMRAQQQISGRISDASTLAPLGGAALIALEGPEAGDTLARSSRLGDFTFTAPRLPFRIGVVMPGYERLPVTVSQASGFLGLGLRPTERALDQVLITGHYTERPQREQAASVGVLTPRDLSRENGTAITPALNRIPGVYMHSGTLGTHRITIRGIGSRTPFGTAKIRAYLEEIPLTGGDGETSLEDIDLSVIGRVQVLKGPASSLYGSGLGGVILMNANRPAYGTSELYGTATAGSYGLLRSTGRASFATAEATTETTYNYTRSNGWRENNDYLRYGFTSLRQVYGKKNVLTVLTNFIRVKSSIPSSIDSATYRNAPQSAAPAWLRTRGNEDYVRFMIGVSLRYRISEAWEGSSASVIGFRENNEIRPFNLLRESSFWLGSRSLLRYRDRLLGRPLRMLAGFELYEEWYNWQLYQNRDGQGTRGSNIGDNRELRGSINLFSQLELELSRASWLNIGFNLNRTDYDYRDYYNPDSLNRTGAYRFRDLVSPRAALVHRFGPRMLLHASVSHGFSPPTVSETLTPEGLINPEIRPEQGWSYELGLRSTLLRDSSLYLELSAYRMLVRDLLVAERTVNDQLVGRNAGRTRHDGIELTLNWRWDPGAGLALRWWGSGQLGRYRFVEFVDRSVDYSGNPLTGVPAATANLGLDVDHRRGWFGRAAWAYVSQISVRDDATLYTDPYALLNAQAGWEGPLGGRFRLKAYAGVQNAANARYVSMVQVNAPGARASARYYYPGMPRNYYAILELGIRI